MKYSVVFILMVSLSHVVFGQNSPVANDDYFTVQKNLSTILPVTSNDFDVDGDTLSISVLVGPIHGLGVVSGLQITYTPTTNFIGNDTILYRLCETGTSDCDTATAFIVVSGTNTPPTVSVSEVYFGDTLTSALVDVGAYDADNDSIYFGEIIDPDSTNSLGSLLTQDLQFIFIRSDLACGMKTYIYTLCDAVACDTFQLTVSVVCPSDVFIVEGFSPNGDGKNDVLVFKGLEYFSPAALRVFNRYGTTVYESEDYKNDWNGTANDSGNALPSGTYYYTLHLSNGRNYNNYLVINR